MNINGDAKIAEFVALKSAAHMSRGQMVTHLEPLVTIVIEPFITHVTIQTENQNLLNAKSVKQR